MKNIHLIKSTVVALFLRLSSAFLVIDNCPVTSPCTCSGSFGFDNYILCENKNLTSIPAIKQTTPFINKSYLHFYSNKLTVIPDNAFRNYSLINASEIELRLDKNQIHSIEINAFNGLGNSSIRLQLQDNDLKAIPLAVGYIVNLTNLNIRGNPINHLDAFLMSKIGRSLIKFELDLDNFTEWPREFHYLRKLKILDIHFIPFQHLDINAFHGLENNLEFLTIDNSNLEKVPYAICQLRRLSLFSFSYGRNLQENTSSIFESCGRNLTTVRSLALTGNYVHNFPDVFNLFPSLHNLSLYLNKIEYIDDSKIPISSKLTSLELSSNRFDRIPYAVNRLKYLELLYINDNYIKTIYTPDIAELTSLTILDLHDNPLMYIAPDAFDNNVELKFLQLSRTLLNAIPDALTHLTKLTSLYLSGMSIDCSCDMSYLKHWNVSTVTTFPSKCAFSSDTIKYFVMNSLQYCV